MGVAALLRQTNVEVATGASALYAQVGSAEAALLRLVRAAGDRAEVPLDLTA
ncbi:MAG: hypothetical protein QOG63_3156 [Thermoleophilaceae bacterium]|jgi:hypothetical protein|nr:hypothetical protein [Thermoleophilaceae bacterium]